MLCCEKVCGFFPKWYDSPDVIIHNSMIMNDIVFLFLACVVDLERQWIYICARWSLALLINATSHWGDGKHGLFLERYLPRLSVTLWRRLEKSYCLTKAEPSQTRFIEREDGKRRKCSAHLHTSYWFDLFLSFLITSLSVWDTSVRRG